jgi:hypothetical protein
MRRLRDIVTTFEFSKKDFKRNVVHTGLVLLGLYFVLGRGASDQSDIITHGVLNNSANALTVVETDTFEEMEKTELGFYVNGEVFDHKGGTHEYSPPLGDLNFGFRIKTQNEVKDIGIDVDGIDLRIVYAKKEGVWMGNSTLRDFTTTNDTYAASLSIKYNDSSKEKIEVEIRPR